MYGDSLDAQSDIGGVDGAVQAALARTEVADGLASLSASAARKGPSQSQVASFFAERAHLWPSLSLVEPPLAQVHRYRAMFLPWHAPWSSPVGLVLRHTQRKRGSQPPSVRTLATCLYPQPATLGMALTRAMPFTRRYIVVVAVEGAGHHLIGEWVRHQRLSLVKSKFYDCHRSAATRLSWPRCVLPSTCAVWYRR